MSKHPSSSSVVGGNSEVHTKFSFRDVKLKNKKPERRGCNLKSKETCRRSIKPKLYFAVLHTLSVQVIVQRKYDSLSKNGDLNPHQFRLSFESSSGSDCWWKISSRKCNGPSAKPALTHHSWLPYECTSAYGEGPGVFFSRPEDFHFKTGVLREKLYSNISLHYGQLRLSSSHLK